MYPLEPSAGTGNVRELRREEIAPTRPKRNPVTAADLRPIKNRKFIKPPLDPRDVERGAVVLKLSDRIYYDHLRFTGCRKDEGNRTEWKHLMLDDVANAFAVIPGYQDRRQSGNYSDS